MSSDNVLSLAGVPLNELHRIKDDLATVNSKLIRRQKMLAPRIEAVNEAIRMAETPANTLNISDHAIVRWLERVEGVDLEPIRQQIRRIVAGKYDPHAEHEVVISEEDRAVVIIRGRRKADKTPPMVTTILDTDGIIPEKGQLSVMAKKDDLPATT